MGSEWRKIRLGDVATVQSGFAFKGSDMGEDGCPLIKIKNICPPDVDIIDVQRIPYEIICSNDRILKFALKTGDILIAMTGATVGKIGRMPISNETCYLNQRVGKVFLRHESSADYNFLYYILSQKAYIDEMFGIAYGSAQANISGSQIEGLSIWLPPLPEQKRIAQILGSLDDKIELNQQTNKTLEEIARALFKSWFVDFDPVKAKMEGRWTRNQSLPGLPSHLFDLFPDHFEDSALGEIPAGWRAVPLAEAAEINPPRRIPKGVQAPYVEMASLPTVGHQPSEWPLRQVGSGARFENGDTLLARITPCLENGKTGYVDFLADGEVGWGSTEYIVIHPRDPLPPEWGYLLARDPNFRDFAIQRMEGTSGRQRVSAEAVGAYLVCIPTSDIATQFSDLLISFFGRIKSNCEEVNLLGVIRDTILPELLTGRVFALTNV